MSLKRRPAEPDTTGDALVTNAQRIAARRRLVEAQEAEARRFEAASRRRTTTGKSSLETFRVRAARLRAVGRQSAGRRS